MTHAGFWVDGAVRKPEARHCDSEDTVITRWKRKGDREQTLGVSDEFDICQRSFSKWDCVYWLDTTPRESLTPEELFSVLKVIWPKCENVFDPGVNASVEWQVQLDDTNEQTPITWGNIRQYPSPIEPQWIRITRENVGQYLFRDCRFRDADIDKWNYGKVAGWCETESRTLVNSDFKDEMYVMNWNIVEVQT
jgi:hypothetical protein